MGYLRLLLALLVLFSHANGRLGALNPGVTAVIVFYLISGYVMAGLFQRHYAQASRIGHFYADRALRLLPQYLFYATLTLAWHLGSGQSTLFLSREPSAVDLLNNLLVVPLNYYMFNGAEGYTLIPPAWSLGAELQFYLLVPLMLLRPAVAMALGVASLVVHALAWHGVVHTDWFGYRLLPGVLWVFACGMALFHLNRVHALPAAMLAWSAPCMAALVYTYLKQHGLHTAPYHAEVLLGWGGGLPLVHLLSKVRTQPLDDKAGDLAYGVFLNHFLLIWWLPWPVPEGGTAGLNALTSLAYWCLLGMLSIALSWLSFRFVERPWLVRRRRWRSASTTA